MDSKEEGSWDSTLGTPAKFRFSGFLGPVLP